MKRTWKTLRPARVLLLAVTLFGCKQDKDECVQPERCQLAPDSGPCFASIPKYYYDKTEKRCKVFTYGGCQGVVPFETLEECKTCECK
jgi:hypothetical protein